MYGPPAATRGWTWIGDTRLAVGAKPTPEDIERLGDAGITHIVNCRAREQHIISQDLWAERAALGQGRVRLAPMWDSGRPQDPRRWAGAVEFAIRALDQSPDFRVLIHCQQGRRRSAMVAYAVLRVRGLTSADAAGIILSSRPVARIVPAYRASVESWLASRPAPSLP